jgi:hypothetical protein
VQIQISQRLHSLGVTPAPARAKIDLAPTPEFGSTRSVPLFVPGRATPTPTKPTSSPEEMTVPVAQPKPKSESGAVQPVESAQLSKSVPNPTQTESVVTVEAQTSEIPPQQSAIPKPPTPTLPPAPSAPPTPEPIKASAVPVTNSVSTPELDAALVRIREIKSLVNEQVGNPVNLVDIDNTVGREYMSALLDAMKQLNSGNGSAASMTRLENAYQSVETVLQAKKTASAQINTNDNKATEPVVSSVPPVAVQESVVERTTPVEPAVVPNPPSPALSSDGTTTSAVSTQPDVTPATPISVNSKPQQVSAQTSTANTKTDDRWGEAVPKSTAPVSPVVPIGVPAPVVSAERSVAPSTPIRSLADSAIPLKTINDVPTAAAMNSSESGDPLFTQEVTNGLNQLLVEWTLFKKSGLFGTGPNGVSHPLYVKVKDLQVPLLLAGRFEGATQEIKQSVTDYMNGWRYEQGIIYEQGETFDHYLRRVIRHILDLQN